jgi:hypothetical protein
MKQQTTNNKQQTRKFLPHVISSCLVLALTFLSCNKNTSSELTSKETPTRASQNASPCSNGNDIYYQYNGINIAYEVDDDMLRFETLQDFDTTVKMLDKEYYGYNDKR